ncbi:TonB-dependent receptor [Zymomonas mobilis]|uniref:TonB-dependent receptor n=1 Tax=Zymomonas mobilis TaxID=542 RepID=UPI0021C4C113|nr:TonB-dependent receptor [Zymomonas mobilis]MCP9307442.1 TonB-dependent receptor [Zymomonas mobilis]
MKSEKKVKRRFLKKTTLVTMLLSSICCVQTLSSAARAEDIPVEENASNDATAEKNTSPTPRSHSKEKISQSVTSKDIEVVASRKDLLGKTSTASEGSITAKEIQLRPAYRVGQILEAVPGLVVTTHSGEGKANQFLLRGFNLDHGTDLATFVDDVPVNGATNAHGQGYTDINFLIPETLGGVDYTKGPFHANIGDFGVAGSDHMKLADDIPRQVSFSGGTLGDYRFYIGGTTHFKNGDRWVNALSLQHADGPWKYPDNARSIRAMSHYTHGDNLDGFDVTAMYYRGKWRATNDQPIEAIETGMISRYGSLDPTDGGFAERYGISGHYRKSGSNWKFVTSAFATHSRMTLWNDFTHYLDDPVNGDQHSQHEARTTFGGSAVYSRNDYIGDFKTDTQVGLQGRYDILYVNRRHTYHRQALEECPGSLNPSGRYLCNGDNINLGAVGFYVENTTHWLPWLRTVVGFREDYQGGTDDNLVDGSTTKKHQWLFQPKGSLIFGPWKNTELYFSGGKGYHSNDFRSVSGSYSADQFAQNSVKVPLMTAAVSGEIGIRTTPIKNLHMQAAVFLIDFDSELSYDGDAGVNTPGPASRRKGVEFSAQYNPLSWLEFNTDLSFAHARYRTKDPSQYGIDGLYVTNAPKFVWAFGILADSHKAWYGSLQVRWLGSYPLNEDNSLRSKGYREVNLSVGYRVSKRLRFEASIFNLFNNHGYAAQYAYDYRLTPTSAVSTGATGHSIEPRSARFSVIGNF